MRHGHIYNVTCCVPFILIVIDWRISRYIFLQIIRRIEFGLSNFWLRFVRRFEKYILGCMLLKKMKRIDLENMIFSFFAKNGDGIS